MSMYIILWNLLVGESLCSFMEASLTNSVSVTLSVSPTDLEVQVVGLIKIIIDPEAIMTETAVSPHFQLTLLRHQLTYKPHH